MKIHLTRFIAALAALVALASCTSKPSPQYDVDLQHGFEKSPVKVWTDERLIYQGRVTTDHSLGLAHHVDGVGTCASITVQTTCHDGTTLTKTFQPHRNKGSTSASIAIRLNIPWTSPSLANLSFTTERSPLIARSLLAARRGMMPSINTPHV
jgi:hypothetical protein